MVVGGALSIALSGISSAHKRVEVASHNVANYLTEDFRPLRTHQSSEATGGSSVQVEQASQPEPVDLAKEFIESDLAAVQAKASARVVNTELDVLGSLLDLHA